jgi:hypothetical protein
MIGAVAPRAGGGGQGGNRDHFENRLPMLASGQRMNDAKCAAG